MKMFLQEDDEVSTHTLAAAARQILLDLMRAKGAESPFYSFVRPERLKEVITLVNEAPNFLKHADRDPDGTLTFRPVQTELLLYDAAAMYPLLTGRALYAGSLFQLWFYVKHSDLMLKNPVLGPVLERIRESTKDDTDAERRQHLLALWDEPVAHGFDR